MKVINQFTYNHEKSHKIVDDLPSLTIPNQSIPIKTLLKKHVANEPLGTSHRQPIYEGDLAPLGVPFESLDLTEKDHIEKLYRKQLADINERYNKAIEDNYKLQLTKDVVNQLHALDSAKNDKDNKGNEA